MLVVFQAKFNYLFTNRRPRHTHTHTHTHTNSQLVFIKASVCSMPILLAESRCGIGIQWIEEDEEWMESGKQAKRKEKQKVKRRPQIFPKSKKYM